MGLLFLITSLHLPLSRIVLFLWPVCPLQPLCNLFILSRVFFSFPVLPCPHLEAHPPSPLITSPYHFNLAFFDTSTTLNAPLTAALLVLLFFFFFFDCDPNIVQTDYGDPCTLKILFYLKFKFQNAMNYLSL